VNMRVQIPRLAASIEKTANAISGQGSSPSQSPYTGTPFAAPGSFEAENFDLGGEGVAYHDAVAGNAGGQYRTAEDVDIISPATGLLLLLGTLPKVIGPSFLLWTLAGMGAYCLARKQHSFFTFSFLGFSFAAVCTGLYFRNHYFVMLLPAVSLLAGVGLAGMAKTFLRPALAVFVAGVGISLFLQRGYLFAMDPTQASAAIYGENPFPEAQTVARYLRVQSPPQARIAVLGSEPEIYFYADRHSATGYIYTYGLMEPQKYAARMEDEMIGEIEQSRPEYVVYVSSPPSWLRQKTSGDHIFIWAAQFLATRYERLELPGSGSLQIFRRRTSPSPQLTAAGFRANESAAATLRANK